MAKTAADEELKTAAEEKPCDPWTDLVPVKLFKDNEKYNDDVFVALNGHRYLIKRGETVMVPKCIKEILDNSEAQRRHAEEMQSSLSSVKAN